MKTKISLGLFTAVLICCVTTFGDDVADSTLTKEGQDAPIFEIKTLDGKMLKLKDLRGKVVLVNFFATWCGPCLAEMPHLESNVWQKFKGKNFVMVSIGREHTDAELLKFLETHKFTFSLAADPKRTVYGQYAKAYIPRNYVIDAIGKIAFQSVGYDEAEFARMIKVLQKEIENSTAK